MNTPCEPFRPGIYWCGDNSIGINPKKAHSITATTRQDTSAVTARLITTGMKIEHVTELVSWCIKPSRITSGLRETFTKIYAVERTQKKAEIRVRELISAPPPPFHSP